MFFDKNSLTPPWSPPPRGANETSPDFYVQTQTRHREGDRGVVSLRGGGFSTDPSEIGRASSAYPRVTHLLDSQWDKDTLQRFTLPFNQPDKKFATRHLETSNDSTTRENDLSLRSRVRGGGQFHYLSFFWVNTRSSSEVCLETGRQPVSTRRLHSLCAPAPYKYSRRPGLHSDRLVPAGNTVCDASGLALGLPLQSK